MIQFFLMCIKYCKYLKSECWNVVFFLCFLKFLSTCKRKILNVKNFPFSLSLLPANPPISLLRGNYNHY